MMPDDVKKRTYSSPVRQAQARATRARIMDAATRLFLDAGYARTSTAAIARAAGTSEASVFAVFGSKADLLVAVVRDHVVRDSDFPLAAQPIWRTLAAQPDKRPAIEAAARVVRRAHDRSWRLLAVVAAAAQDDPAVAEAHRRAADSRRDDCAWFVREVVGLRDADDADRRIDETWTLISVENYRHLVVDRSWPPERYEAWLSAMLAVTLG
jgi:TetR/AcrR family transcriptional regulator of autoinduction and epiphytic fitness